MKFPNEIRFDFALYDTINSYLAFLHYHYFEMTYFKENF